MKEDAGKRHLAVELGTSTRTRDRSISLFHVLCLWMKRDVVQRSILFFCVGLTFQTRFLRRAEHLPINMDLFVCIGLTALELLVAQSFNAHGLDRIEAITVFLGQYITLKIYRIFLYPNYFSPLRHVPGPKVGPTLNFQKRLHPQLTFDQNNHFLFGQLINLIRAPTPTTLYVEWMKENPEAPFIRYLGFLNNEVLVPNSIAAHKNVLYQNCYSFSKPNWFVRLTKEVAGHGLILMEGQEHKAHRKMLTNSFALNNIRKMEPIFKEKAKNICEFFDQRIAANDGKTGTFDCIDTFMKAILDISKLIAFRSLVVACAIGSGMISMSIMS